MPARAASAGRWWGAARRPARQEGARGRDGGQPPGRLHALRLLRLHVPLEHPAAPALRPREGGAAPAPGGRMSAPSLLVSASPPLGAGGSTPTIMWNVVASLLPIVAVAA